MKGLFFRLATVATLAASAVAQFMINTPTGVVVCQPIQFSWSGGTAPYFLSLQDGNAPDGAALKDFGQVAGTSFLWTANVAAGTSLSLRLRDSGGQVAQSAPFTVQSGTDTSCVGKDPSTTAGATTPGSSAATPPPASSAPATPAPSTTAPASSAPPATSKPASSAPASSTKPASSGAASSSTPNAAGPTQAAAQMGVAGVLGAAVIAILA